MKIAKLFIWFLACFIVFLTGCSDDDKPAAYLITVTNDGNGTAVADQQRAEAGATVTLTATPGNGYVFLKWTVESGDVAITDMESNPATFTMPAGDVTIKAEFIDEEAQPYTITVTNDGNGIAKSNKAEAKPGEMVTLTATPKKGYIFRQWTVESGDLAIEDAESNPVTFAMPAGDVTVKAEFIDELVETYTITVIDDGNGTAVSDRIKAEVGTKVTLTATPKDEYEFNQWRVQDGELIITRATANPTTFIMCKGDVTIKAEFTKINYAVKVTYDSDGTAVADKEKAGQGETVKLTATPKEGCVFSRWTVDSGNVTFDDPTINPIEFAMPSGDVKIKAEFIDPTNIFKMITDPAFLSYCRQFDTDGNGKLHSNEAAAVKAINIYNKGISSLAGIEYFISLEKLECNSNNLSSLDLSNNTALTYLGCSNNALTYLNVTNNRKLEYLSCGINQLSNLDLSNNNALTVLWCNSNKLTSLNLSSDKVLVEIHCSQNNFGNLDFSNYKALERLDCVLTQLTSLNVSGCESLKRLSCNFNKLTSLDVKDNPKLEFLGCHSNELTNLDLSNNTQLDYLNCEVNQLTILDVSNNTKLDYLSCGVNKLGELDISKNKELKILNCYYNLLSELDASNMALKNGYLDLTCGMQMDGSSSYQELRLILRDDLKPLWNGNWPYNDYVILVD